jgi:ElaB/YqjD/DUF883 family membrane-anchored ribosome-binding protein
MKNETTFSPTDIGAEIAGRAVERLATTARDAREELSTRIARLKVQARKQQKQARAVLRSQVKKTTGYVRRNPLTGLGIAFAAGVVVYGLLFRR